MDPSQLDEGSLSPRPLQVGKPAGKSSSYNILRTQTPKLFTKFRSFSNGRVSSSKATCRRCSVESNTSSSEGSYDPDPVLPLNFDTLDTCGFHQPSSSLAPIRESGGLDMDCSFMIPQIRIIPEMTTLGDNDAAVWVAIEVSGQIHGYLYEVRLDITPTGGNDIIDLINRSAPRCISPGSSHLTLAHVKVGSLQPPQKTGLNTCEPESVIADLEYQLGNTKTNFVEVKLSYCHSGFPQTRLETTAVGTVKRHNPSSVWSPSQSLVFNDLMQIAEAHWGRRRAYDIKQQISSFRTGPRERNIGEMGPRLAGSM